MKQNQQNQQRHLFLHLPHLMMVGKDVKIGVVGDFVGDAGVVVCFESVVF